MPVAGTNKNLHAGKAVSSRSRCYLPLGVLIVGVALSVAIYFWMRDREETIVRVDFEMLSASHAAAIGNELTRHLDASDALAGLFDVSQRVGRPQFDRFASNLLTRHSDIQALMWAPRVGVEERAALVRQAGRDGIKDYHIHGGDDEASDRAIAGKDSFPVFYIQPMRQNDSLLGIDLMARSAYRGLLDTARDTGNMAVSAPVQLNLKTGDDVGNGVLLARAVYRNDANLETVAGRRAGLRGYVLQLLRIGDLIEEALRESAVLGLDISVVYGKNPAAMQRNYFHSSASSPDHRLHLAPGDSGGFAPSLRLRTPLDALGKLWGLLFTPAPRFWFNHPMRAPWAVLTAGLMISALLAVISFLLLQRSDRSGAREGGRINPMNHSGVSALQGTRPPR